MHLAMPKKFRFAETTPHSLRFAGDGGEKLEVYVLEERPIRGGDAVSVDAFGCRHIHVKL